MAYSYCSPGRQNDWAQQPPHTTLLPSLVETLGYQALSKPSPARLGRILEHWIAVGALEVKDGQVILGEPYALTLYERRQATMLLRGPAHEEQVRLEKFLKEIK